MVGGFFYISHFSVGSDDLFKLFQIFAGYGLKECVNKLFECSKRDERKKNINLSML